MEKISVNFEEIDSGYSVQIRDELMPDKRIFPMSVWNTARLEALLNVIKPGEWKGKEVVLSGLSPSWVMAAALNKGQPDRAYHITHYLGDSEQEIYSLPIGKETEDSGIVTEIIEDGDKIYLWVGADYPDRGGHFYPAEKLRLAVAPEIPKGKDLFIIVDGATFIQLCYIKTYIPVCRSVSISFFLDRVNNDPNGDRLFTCCYSAGGPVKLGDQTKVPASMHKIEALGGGKH